MRDTKPLSEQKSFSLSGASDFLIGEGYNISTYILRQAIFDGSLKCVCLTNGSRRTYIITRDNLMRWINQEDDAPRTVVVPAEKSRIRPVQI